MSQPVEIGPGSELAARHEREAPFSFSSPRASLLAEGPGKPLRALTGALDVADVQRALEAARREGCKRPVVTGALPFDLSQTWSLSLHERVTWREPGMQTARPGSDAHVNVRARQILPWPAASSYTSAVARAVERIRAGELHKVVLSRALDIELPTPPDLDRLLLRLAQQNPNKYVFRCDLPSPRGARRALLGASPELLIEKHGQDVTSHPLAGSAPRSADPAEDMERARKLARCPKNRREHAFVVDAVAEVLAPYCKALHVPTEPALVQTATMWHLGTKIMGELRDPQVSSLALAKALHPTPAVGGEPAAPARRLIDELEGFDRGYFAGAVGYCDAKGDGEWAVTIRCAEASGRSIRLYAGAGVVADSTPEAELDETAAKFNTMLRALGIDPMRQVC